MRSINLAVVHCSATPEGRHVTVEEIDSWHRARGWSGIGYHAVVHLDGTVHAGRPVERVGAHVAGWNSHSLGVCYIGGLDRSGRAKDTRTDAQKAALEAVLRDWCERFPISRIAGHREFAAKACPCFDAKAAYSHILTGESPEPPKPAEPDFILKRGSFGQSVREWQGALRRFYPTVAVDGDFGPTTQKVTRWFQEAFGLLVDGKVGPQTREMMAQVQEALSDLG